MNQISRFVIWICARFNREQIELIVKELSNILKSKQDFPTKPKDAFKEQHPNYREYTVDPTPPLTEPVNSALLKNIFIPVFLKNCVYVNHGIP